MNIISMEINIPFRINSIILPPETAITLYNYLYLEHNTAYASKYRGAMGHKIDKKNPAQSFDENSLTVFGPRLTTRCQDI